MVTKHPSILTPTSASFSTRKMFSGSGASGPLVITPPVPSWTSESQVCEIQAKTQVEPLAKVTSSSMPEPLQPQPQSEEFPALECGKKRVVSAPAVAKVAFPASLTYNAKNSTHTPALPAASKSDEIQSTPNLSISVPTRSNAKPKTTVDNSKQPVPFPPLPTSTNPSVNSPLTRNITKTLRLSTPKIETSTGGISIPVPSSSVLPSQFPKNRQLSFTTITRLDRPGTPTSEIISDNASITSTSFSRASSPPLTRVGSAPVRTATKSSQKKQRQAQKEKDRFQIEAAVVVASEVEIAPIMGRKKKMKKKRLSSPAGTSTLTPSKPKISGSHGNIGELGKKFPVVDSKPELASNKQSDELEASKISSKSNDPKINGKSKSQVAQTSDCPSASPEAEIEPVEKPPPTPATIFQELLASDAIKSVNELYLLKNISSSNRHFEVPDKPDNIDTSPKLAISPEDHDILLSGKPIHKNAGAGCRIMLTPNGDCVRNLTEDEEKSYLDYQAKLAKDFGPATFVSTKHLGQNGFTMIGGRAVPSGPPSFFPVPNKGTTSFDPVSKIQRDEALNYINQYVLPTLSSNTQLDKTLNANSIQGEMMRSSSADASWKTWSSNQVSNTVGTGDFYMSHSPNSEGMIENIATHFPLGDIGRQGSGSLLSLTDAESSMQVARKEVEGLEKRLNALIKKNRRLLLGTGH